MKKILILFLVLSFFTKTTNAQVIQSDFDALVALYNATDGANWINNDGWSTTTNNVSSLWRGVTVSGNRVTKLNLQYNNLVGTVPAAFGDLTELDQLSFGGNKLTNIPVEIGNLTKLTTLVLGSNLLTSIPSEIGLLTELTRLSFDRNQLSVIPAEIGNLTKLSSLYLGNNLLQNIPDEIGGLTQLTELYLESNDLSVIPSVLFNLTTLQKLRISGNSLTSVPPEIGNLTSLVLLDLYLNRLTTLPFEIGNLTLLTELSLTYNDFTTIPLSVFSLPALETLSINRNKLTSISNQIGNLSTLKILLVDYNQLTSIPVEVSNLTALNQLDIDNNQISALSDFSTLTNLTTFNINDNILEFGDIEAANVNWGIITNSLYAPQADIQLNRAESTGQVTFTSVVSGSNNQYKWFKDNVEIPGETLNTITEDATQSGLYFCEITDTNFPLLTLKSTVEAVGMENGVFKSDYDALIALYDATNGDNWNNKTNWKTTEQVSTWFGVTVTDNRVTQIDLASNNLIGLVPSAISGLTALEDFRLNDNQITSIPVEIGNLSALQRFDFSQNQLTTLPVEIGNLAELVSLNLWGNQLSTIPSTVGSLTKLTSVYLYSNQLTSLPAEIGAWTSLLYFRLNDNQLSTLPPEIANITALLELRINDNKLSSLPDLATLTSLTTTFVENNLLDFGDLEASNINWDTYSPQADIQLNRTESGGQITLSCTVSGTNNQYKWFKNSVEITGETLNTLTINDNESGNYYCTIVDTNYPLLTLKSTNEEIGLVNGVSKEDYDALVAIYNATGGDNWTNNTNWLSDSPVSEWLGISVTDARVSGINLSSNNLIGNIPPEIGNLSMLTIMDCGRNQIINIPKEIGLLANITSITLDRNKIASIPAEIGNLSKLKRLQLISNEITSIPVEIGNLSALTFINLGWNSLTEIPLEIWNLSNLESLTLSSNRLTSIPSGLDALTKLQGLFFDSNQITSIPKEIGVLVNLKYLYCSSNEITEIPAEIGNLTNLLVFQISGNKITKIPIEIGNLSLMYKFSIAYNQILEIPIEIGNLTALKTLELYRNEISVLPAEIGNLTELETLSIWGNQLSTIPSTIGNLTKLTKLNLNTNQLTNLPSVLANCTLLSELYIYNNKLSSLPDLSVLTNLNTFYIQNNLFDFGDLETVNVDWATITNKAYNPQGYIAVSLSENTSDYTLTVTVDGTNNTYQWFKNDIEITGGTSSSITISKTAGAETYYCKITDTNFPDLTLNSESIFLPAGVSKVEYDALVAIYNATDGANWTDNTNWLSNNPVVEWYGVDVAQNKVMAIDLSNNNLTGNIPPEIGDLYALVNLNFDDNELGGNIPYQIGYIPGLFMLGLNNNNFSNTIPSSIANCSNLNYLGLSGNQFTGKVPEELSNLSELGYLVLFNNQLSGLPDLSGLQNIEIISVEENKLTFEDIEPNLNIASMGFSYSPQATIGKAEKRFVIMGENDTLSVNVGGEYNVYNWYKDGALISGTDNDSLIIENFSVSAAGEYYCTISNTMATDLVLHSDTFTLTGAYSVTFNVSDKNGALSNATVTVSNYGAEQTDAEGAAVFQVKPSSGIVFSITATGYDNYSGSFDIVDKHEQIDVAMVITGIGDLNKTDIKVYPNPSNGIFTLDIGDLQIKNTYLKILDINGRVIYREKLNAAKTQINIPGNHQGPSIIQVSDDESVYLEGKIFIVR